MWYFAHCKTCLLVGSRDPVSVHGHQYPVMPFPRPSIDFAVRVLGDDDLELSAFISFDELAVGVDELGPTFTWSAMIISTNARTPNITTAVTSLCYNVAMGNYQYPNSQENWALNSQ